MEYHVKRIQNRSDIEQCEKFQLSHASWRCVKKPKTCGFLGYLEGKGLFLSMRCEEDDPKRLVRKHRGAVWRDSAMEMFLAFPIAADGSLGGLSNDSLYLNFEINANGALYAQYGYGRKGRCFVPERVYEECGVRSQIGNGWWSAQILVPEWFLRETCRFSPGASEESGRFYCNFYKISEDPEIEHYLSFSEIQNETPNFHLPVYFAAAVII